MYDFRAGKEPLPRPPEPEFYWKAIACLGSGQSVPKAKSFDDLVILGRRNLTTRIKQWRLLITDLKLQLATYRKCLRAYDQHIDKVLAVGAKKSRYKAPQHYPTTFYSCNQCKFLREEKSPCGGDWCGLCGPGVIGDRYKDSLCVVGEVQPRQKIEKKIHMLERYLQFAESSVEILTKASMTTGGKDAPMIPAWRPRMKYITGKSAPVITIVQLVGQTTHDNWDNTPDIALRCHAHYQKDGQHAVICEPNFVKDQPQPRPTVLFYDDSPFLLTLKDYRRLLKDGDYRKLWLSSLDESTAQTIEAIMNRGRIL